jgi:hypothetical protein
MPKGFNSDNFWAYFWPNKKVINLFPGFKGYRIYTKTWQNGNIIPKETIDKITNIIKENISNLNYSYQSITIETFDGMPTKDSNLQDVSDGVEYLGVSRDGYIPITFADDMTNANGRSICLLDGNTIVGGGIVLLNRSDILSTYLQYVFLHESGHVLFNFYHPFQNIEGSQPSIMNYDHTVSAWSEFDKDIIGIMQHRLSGTKSPDNDPNDSAGFSSKGKITLGELHSDNFILP